PIVPQKGRTPRKVESTETAEVAGLFTGSAEAEERATNFTHGMAREVRDLHEAEQAADADADDSAHRA
ncbi:MAG: hypothetical protein ACK4MD_05235, partial [Demequina sp.]